VKPDEKQILIDFYKNDPNVAQSLLNLEGSAEDTALDNILKNDSRITKIAGNQ